MESPFEPQGQAPETGQLDSGEEPSQGRPVFQREGRDGQDGGDPSTDVGPTRGRGGETAAESLRDVIATLEAESPPEEAESPPDGGEDSAAFPKQPRTLAELGLSKAFLTDLTVKIMHYSGTPSAAQLMRRLGLGQTLVQQIVGTLQEERMCEVLSQSDLYTGNYQYRLSERGTARAAEALERTRYAGPAPVTAEQYSRVIRAQQAQKQTPSRQRIEAILKELVLAPETADAVARALYSGKTAILYGPSGNGKTRILESFAHGLEGAVLIPWAVYAYGQIIRVFDPSIHELVEEFDERNAVKDDAKFDRRWVLVRRPAVVLGSEVGSEALDLSYDPQARFYQAPPHVKAQGGVLLADDLGRQKAPPRELLTRWLISVDRGWENLSLMTGEKLTIPLDVQLLFGTNQPIDQLADEALLRRVLYKVEIPSPGPAEFAQIMRQLCQQRNVRTPEGAVERVVQRLYGQPGHTPRAAYARDLLEIVIEGAAFDGQEPVLDDQSFERAFRLFMSQQAAGEAC